VKMCQCCCSETKVEAKAESRGSEDVSMLKRRRRVTAVNMCQCWCSETKVEAKAESRGSEHVSVLV